ncbi:hypothetical protein [Streptomyces sp. NPDC057877]|uniref:hypothetical protein n=1 Tax=Streptomyces sp. NPDC057877 TaxID=3346269 RepID=UPI0036CEBEEE
MDPDWLDQVQLPDDDWLPFPNLVREAVKQARELRPYGWRSVSGPGEIPIVMQRRQGWLGRRRRIQVTLRKSYLAGGGTYVSVEGIGWNVQGTQDLL